MKSMYLEFTDASSGERVRVPLEDFGYKAVVPSAYVTERFPRDGYFKAEATMMLTIPDEDLGAWLHRLFPDDEEEEQTPPRQWVHNIEVKTIHSSGPAKPPRCSKCGLVNEYADPNPNYICYECRT